MDQKIMERIKFLEDEIIRHKALYYQGRPEISDFIYDKLEDELRILSPKSPVLQLVGTKITTDKKVKHEVKMLSLAKTYSEDELIRWINGHEVVSTLKIDGVSCSLVYENGILQVAKTRGDGTFGEDIFEKVLWINAIPKDVIELARFEVRGELYCSEIDFFHLSNEMVMLGLPKPSSQRNIVAGLLGRKENLELSRFINFYAFDLLSDAIKIEDEWNKPKILKKLGFSVPEFHLHKDNSKISDVISDAKDLIGCGEFLIDGIVFTYNNLKLQDQLGSTSHHPRYRMAFKFQGISKEAKIKDIEWSISRNGVLTPVAEIEPTELSGATITRVTLHNYGIVKQYELKPGDVIEVIRSGEVIPKFLSVVKSGKGATQIPESCPSCESNVLIDDIRLRCPNQDCPGRSKYTILNFIQNIGIEDLSSKRLDEMMRIGLIKDIPDLYKLEKEDLLKLDKVKDKLANKLYESIQKSKNVDIVTFLSALGISGGAYNKCSKIVKAGHDTLTKIKNLTTEKIEEIEGFAEKSSAEFVSSVQSKIPLIESLEELGFQFKEKQRSSIKTAISGKKLCITGALSHKRSDVEKWIDEAGGQMVGSVSKNTDFLVTNEEDSSSSKYKKAVQLGIPIINENKLIELLKPF